MGGGPVDSSRGRELEGPSESSWKGSRCVKGVVATFLILDFSEETPLQEGGVLCA